MNILRSLSLSLIIVFLMQNMDVFAYAYWENHKDEAIETLQEYNIIRDEAKNWDQNYITTRRDCLTMIARIIDLDGWEKLSSSGANNVKKYMDIDSNTKDAALVEAVDAFNILNGKINGNGELVADLDSAITWEEALIMIDRIFLGDTSLENNKDGYVNYFYSSVYVDKEDWWYTFSKEVGIINSSSSVLFLDYENKDEKIGIRDFSYLAYKALYVPVMFTGYFGDFTYYYIDSVIYRSKNTAD